MLENKVAIITGGTRGIGLAIVRNYLNNGAKVILKDDLTKVVKEIEITLDTLKATYTKEQNQLYNHIYSIVANSGSIVLSDYVGKVEQLLYLLYDLEGEDKFLDFIFHDPTQTYLNRVRSLLPPMDDETRELVRKHLHNYSYYHLLTYDYKTLKSIRL